MAVMAKRKKKPGTDWHSLMKGLRDSRAWTQAQAAERIGISQSQWSAFESGTREPTRPIALLINLLASGNID